MRRMYQAVKRPSTVRIIEQSGGSMELESEPGDGTSETIYLPH